MLGEGLFLVIRRVCAASLRRPRARALRRSTRRWSPAASRACVR
nr:MAG TPA: hypothetical protein [Caudoviricetes sp.]